MPIDPATQIDIPPGGSGWNLKAWFQALAASIRHQLVFTTLTAANQWASDNPALATPGRLAWITGENAQYVRSATGWISTRPPQVAGERRNTVATATQSIPASTDTVVTNMTAYTLSGGVTAQNNGLVAPADGMYTCSATILWEPNATGFRRLRLRVLETAVVLAETNLPGAGVSSASQAASSEVFLTAGQTVQATAYHNVTTPVNLTSDGFRPRLTLARVGG